MITGYRKLFKSKKGTTLIIFVLSTLVLTAAAAMTIDIGAFIVDKAKLSNAVDSAALAGAQELITNYDTTESVVNSYLNKNCNNLKSKTITTDSSAKTVEVEGVKAASGYFSKFFTGNIKDIKASAKAQVANIYSLNGVRPLAVIQQTFAYGSLYTLKEGGGDGTTGNYGAVALGGRGGAVYGNNLLYGYDYPINVGDLIETEPGNIAGITETSIHNLIHQCDHTPFCTYYSYNPNCSRIIFLPVVNTLTVNGRSCVEVLGFATFFLEGSTCTSGHADVIGRFITYSMEGETSSEINDYGTYGIQLIK